MGLFGRLTAGIRAKGRALSGSSAEGQDGPGESCEAIREALETTVLEQGLLIQQLKAQTLRLEGCIPGLDELARKAVAQGRDERALEALYRKLGAARQIGRLRGCLRATAARQARLSSLTQRLKVKIDAFSLAREANRHFSAEEAGLRTREASAGLGEELAALDYAVARAQEALAGARECLTASAGPPAELAIPDRDRAFLTSALEALRAEVKRSDRPHPQR